MPIPFPIISKSYSKITSGISFPSALAFHTSGTCLYVVDGDVIGEEPCGVAVHPAGTFVYVAITKSGTISVIDTASFSVVAVIPVGLRPEVRGQFIVPAATMPADLSLTMQDTPDPIGVGQSLTYTVTIANNGPHEATAVTLTDTFPTGVTFTSVDATQENCILSLGKVRCTLGTLPHAGSAHVTITVIPTSTRTITNAARITSNTLDPNSSNDSGASTTTVKSVRHLTVTVKGSGTVSSPAIACASTCTADYRDGAIITVTATPASGWQFTGWGGACSGTGVCSLSMSADRTVSATFSQVQGTPRVNLILNQATFHPGSTLILTGTLIPGSVPQRGDIYVALQPPDKTLLYLQAYGSLSTDPRPMFSNVTLAPVTAELLRYTLTGSEATGTYTWLAGIMVPGTFSTIGTITSAPIGILP